MDDAARRSLKAVLAGFGLGSVAALPGIAYVWPLVALLLGLAIPTGRLLGGVGLVAAAVTWASLRDQLAPGVAFEGPDYALLYGVPIGALVTGVALGVAPRLLPARSRATSPRSAAAVLPALGLAAVALAIATGAALVSVPSRESFSIELPATWVRRDYQPMHGYTDTTYGSHFTAVHGSSEAPPRIGPPESAVLGVTVIQVDSTPDRCIRDLHGWIPSGPVYQGDLLASDDVTLPAGPAHRIVRRPFDDESRVYGWGFTRERQVGVFREALCYILVLVAPEGSEVGEAEAAAIAASFQFR